MDNFIDELNEQQKEAVTTTEGYVRIIAGAGTGKTKALTYRYAYLVDELGISTSNILCVTFTNKAAREMSKRIRQMIGDSDTGYICTFHGFCVKLLREDIHAINYPQNFVVMDSEDTEDILKTVYENAHIQSRTYTFDMARDHISAMKNEMQHIAYLADISNDRLLAEYEKASDIPEKVFLGYLYEQKKVYGLDYDDLITIALHILRTDAEKCRKWQERMMYVMVDEFQDVSGNQYALAEILSGYHRNLFIVGDPDQTIYTWRGARIEYILEFDKNHENTQTIFLDTNYRSTPDILAVSNSLIEKNRNRLPHRLVAVKPSEARPLYVHSRTTGDEAQWVTNEIKRLVEAGTKYSDIAVLYRSHFVSRSIEEAFIKTKIPYILYSGTEFYKRKEIKDVLAYLRMVAYADDLSFRRVINEPKRNFGKKRMSMLKSYCETHRCSLYSGLQDLLEEKTVKSTGASAFVDIIENFRRTYKEKSLSDLVTELMAATGYEAMLRQAGEQERLDNLAELKQSIDEYEKTSGEENTLEEYLNYGFKRGRFRVERQVYQKFENMLISKLAYLVDKSRKADEPGGVLRGYQLTYIPDSLEKLGSQCGIIFYVPAAYTSKIDPLTGFVNVFNFREYSNFETKLDFVRSLDSIRYDTEKRLFSISFDYDNFKTHNTTLAKTKWVIYLRGERIKKEHTSYGWKDDVWNVESRIKDLFDSSHMKYDDGHNLIEDILELESSVQKKLINELIEIIRLTVQLRNSKSERYDRTEAEYDRIVSPVMDENGRFYDSENYIFNEETELPKDADANGAYCIALKGLYNVIAIKNNWKEGEKFNRKLLSLNNYNWFDFIQNRRF